METRHATFWGNTLADLLALVEENDIPPGAVVDTDHITVYFTWEA